MFAANPYTQSLVSSDVDLLITPLSSLQSLVCKSAVFLALHILLFILLVPQRERGKQQREHWGSGRKHAVKPAAAAERHEGGSIEPAAAKGKHERKDSLMC